MDDFRKIIYGTLIVFIAIVAVWVGFLAISTCGYSVSCLGAAPKVERTSIPTLIPATLPAPVRFLPTLVPTQAPAASASGATTVTVARPSNPGGPGPAVDSPGKADAGKQVFAANCQSCHGADGKGGVANPGSTDGTVPALNPIDPSLVSADSKTYATNLDLFLEHGSTPAGASPTVSMPAWGDKKALTTQQISDVIAYLMSLNPAPASASPAPSKTGTPAAAAPSVPQPSNPGGPGPAMSLSGNADSGKQVFATNCSSCHAADGKGGVANPGSTDGTVPALNPIDPALKNADHKVFAANIDLFIEHGSTPAGASPTVTMPAWGDKKALTPQQIADVIAYLITLNP